MKKILLPTLLLIVSFGIRSQQTMDTYFATNSLVNHLIHVNPVPTQETSVPWSAIEGEAD